MKKGGDTKRGVIKRNPKNIKDYTLDKPLFSINNTDEDKPSLLFSFGEMSKESNKNKD